MNNFTTDNCNVLLQPSQAEKNRVASSAATALRGLMSSGPMRLYVGSLHFNITEEMLRGIFEPFGKVFNPYIVL